MTCFDTQMHKMFYHKSKAGVCHGYKLARILKHVCTITKERDCADMSGAKVLLRMACLPSLQGDFCGFLCLGKGKLEAHNYYFEGKKGKPWEA